MAANTHFEGSGATFLATLSLALPVLSLFSRQRGQSRSILISFSFVFLSSVAWYTFVSQTVPQPYLDEVFHVPQAQRYCECRFLEWDDKITTPPGLVASVAGTSWLSDCGANALRFTNVVGLMVLAYLALLCRHAIESRLNAEAHPSALLETISPYAIHTALNISLFPLLFFFSGLYYTDVLSTAVVLGAFLNHLKRVGRDRSPWLSDAATALLGIAALFMRQTNVFWVVVWMGGLEAIHAIKMLRPARVDQPPVATLGAQLKFYSWRYSVGHVHDPPLGLAWPDDMLFTVISFGIAALCNPVRVMRQIWPYLSILVVFSGFVAWNGGVVLGDKSNHVATIHLAQMLYIWPFFAFFSLPLLLPYAASLVHTAMASLGPASRPAREADPPKLPSARQRTASWIFTPTHAIWLLYLLATLAASATVVQFNTIVHPFTLADNRHYMFYIFRYTIRRGNLVRLLLIIPYTLARWMVWGTLAGCTDWSASARNASSSSSSSSSSSPSWRYTILHSRPFTDHALRIAHGGQSRRTDTAPQTPLLEAPDKQAQDLARKDALALSCEPPSTSTGLVFLLATALSLMTAPLVEPRYFIIPWVMWRLLVPAWRVRDHGCSANGTSGGRSDARSHAARLLAVVFERHDVRLVLETVWLMAINLATGYLFLTRPYVWKDENGQVLDGGRLQRFMW
ncbi:hypothetical protein E4U41_007660 [Claviceps citrina]|nr:hypothetical protein E4U41_007660 [Claviceps citrina]